MNMYHVASMDRDHSRHREHEIAYANEPLFHVPNQEGSFQ